MGYLHELANLLIPILGMGVGLIMAVMVYRLINRAIDSRSKTALAPEEIDELRREIESVRAELHDEMADLGERLDFAERALSSVNRPELPPAGKS